jgi:hypothetical protein
MLVKVVSRNIVEHEIEKIGGLPRIAELDDVIGSWIVPR